MTSTHNATNALDTATKMVTDELADLDPSEGWSLSDKLVNLLAELHIGVQDSDDPLTVIIVDTAGNAKRIGWTEDDATTLHVWDEA